MQRELESIEFGHRPRVLLLGNGLLRIKGNDSWDKVIDDMCSKELSQADRKLISDLPNQLGVIVASNNQVDKKMDEFSKRMLDISFDDEKVAELARRICKNKFDYILTTNYSYEVEKALNPKFQIKPGVSSKYRKSSLKLKDYSGDMNIHQYMDVSNNENRTPPIWHIHGEAAKPKNMVMGHYYYGKLISRYLKEIAGFNKRYSYTQNHNLSFTPHSWIDCFMLSDVHIVGFALDYSEIDIWWLLNAKLMHSPTGVYWYEANVDRKKELLAKSCGIEVISKEVEDGEYLEYYNELDIFNTE